MPTAAQVNDNENIDWKQLMSLSNKDKLSVIATLSESMMEPQIEPEPFEEAMKRAVSIEEFRKLCHQRVAEIYGGKH